MISNKEELRKAVATSIGLGEIEIVTDDYEWDSLDHLAIIMDLGSKYGVDLADVGDLSDANSFSLLALKLNLL